MMLLLKEGAVWGKTQIVSMVNNVAKGFNPFSLPQHSTTSNRKYRSLFWVIVNVITSPLAYKKAAGRRQKRTKNLLRIKVSFT